jgi:hypothetical protein
MTVYPIDMKDVRTYVLPITNIIGRRINRVVFLNTRLKSLITKLYIMPDEDDKTEICNKIERTIAEIELLVLKNIDDSQILEYSLAEFTTKPTDQPQETPNIPKDDSHEFYFA